MHIGGGIESKCLNSHCVRRKNDSSICVSNSCVEDLCWSTTDRSSISCWSSSAGRTCRTCGTGRPCSSRWARNTLGSRDTLNSLWSCISSNSLQSLDTLRARHSLRTLWPCSTHASTCWPCSTCWPYWTNWTRNTLGSLDALCTLHTLHSLRPCWTCRADRPPLAHFLLVTCAYSLMIQETTGNRHCYRCWHCT